jgi:hypothetical protein
LCDLVNGSGLILGTENTTDRLLSHPLTADYIGYVFRRDLTAHQGTVNDLMGEIQAVQASTLPGMKMDRSCVILTDDASIMVNTIKRFESAARSAVRELGELERHYSRMNGYHVGQSRVPTVPIYLDRMDWVADTYFTKKITEALYDDVNLQDAYSNAASLGRKAKAEDSLYRTENQCYALPTEKLPMRSVATLCDHHLQNLGYDYRETIVHVIVVRYP